LGFLIFKNDFEMKRTIKSDIKKFAALPFIMIVVVLVTLLSNGKSFAQNTVYAGYPKLKSSSSKRPNFLIFSLEGSGTYLHCYGVKGIKTPNIDKLASQGIRYTNAYTTAGVCAPSRVAFITGMYAPSIGAQHMRTGYRYSDTKDMPVPYATVPPPYVKGFTEFLRSHGYYVINDNKIDWQFTTGGYPFTLFDQSNIPYNDQNLTKFIKSGKGSWEERPNKNQPWCDIVGLLQIHEHHNWKINHVKTDPSKVTVPPYYPDTPVVRKEIARAYDQIEKADTVIGKILHKLKEDGLAKNTIVMIWTDHGEGFARAKRWLYDSGIHTPLIIRWPGHIKAGQISNRMVSLVDLAPTILSMANIPIPVWMQGKAFMGSQAVSPRKYIFADRDRMDNTYDMIRAIQDQKYEYLENWYSNKPYVGWIPYRNNGPIMKTLLKYYAEGKLTGAQKQWFYPTRYPKELYDVTKDPNEIHNLAYDKDYSNVVQRMHKALHAWQHQIGDLGKIPESQMVQRMWPDHKQPVTAKPQLIPNSSIDRGETPKNHGGILPEPMTLRIYCPTQGASIGYTFQKGRNPHWNLYTGPIKMTSGVSTIRTKAVRYGYKESKVTTATFNVVSEKKYQKLISGN